MHRNIIEVGVGRVILLAREFLVPAGICGNFFVKLTISLKIT